MDYAFTEMMTLHLQADATIEDGLTTAGHAFAQLVKLLLENEGPDKLWWGRAIEKSDVAMVVVDWHYNDARSALLASREFESASESLKAILTAPVESSLVDLEGQSTHCFSDSVHKYTIWTFYADFNGTSLVPVETLPRGPPLIMTQIDAWNLYWQAFVRLTPHGTWGGARDSWWTTIPGASETSPPAFCGLQGWDDTQRPRDYLEMANDFDWRRGGLEKLMEIADGGMDVYHVKFTSLARGWLGDVNKTWEDVKYSNPLLGWGNRSRDTATDTASVLPRLGLIEKHLNR